MGSYYPPPYDNVRAPPAMAADYEQSQQQPAPAAPPPAMTGDAFDILDWYPAYESCRNYFLDHAQHEPGTQALCALVNIRLPFQYPDRPITSSAPAPAPEPPASAAAHSVYGFAGPRGGVGGGAPFVSLVPYIRRLVVTGFDKPAILHGFFGDEWVRGARPHVECERRNYLFAAKHGGWRSCKRQYDTGSGRPGGAGDETLPFMKPLDGAQAVELSAAEKAWSDWLCMEDWMIGPRAAEDDRPDEGQEERTAQLGAQNGVAQNYGAGEVLPDRIGQPSAARHEG